MSPGDSLVVARVRDLAWDTIDGLLVLIDILDCGIPFIVPMEWLQVETRIHLQPSLSLE
ncbi:hypothetical protein HD598_000541 [Neomicrococcus aestuarii]|uniref:Uncharacterized protein n=1 Tax=Neomicrococcus aestuarii TaxID=556325 RepID=A0A7W8TS17_9MICC|nr:hypothetical protein [Neomicrococcus aestuarii]